MGFMVNFVPWGCVVEKVMVGDRKEHVILRKSEIFWRKFYVIHLFYLGVRGETNLSK